MTNGTTALATVEDVLEIIQGDGSEAKPGLVKLITDYTGNTSDAAKLSALIFGIVNICIGVTRVAITAAKSS